MTKPKEKTLEEQKVEFFTELGTLFGKSMSNAYNEGKEYSDIAWEAYIKNGRWE